MSDVAGTAILVPRENVNDESATLVAWLVTDGSQVEQGQAVAQIETSKAVVDLEAPASGLLHHGAKAGQDVPIGGSIGRVGGSVSVSVSMSVSSPASPASAMASHAGAPEALSLASDSGSNGHLAPSVRRLVAEGGVDPNQVPGTGRGGRITKGDVVAFLESSQPEPPPPPRSTRFSRKALERLQALGLDRSTFEGRGLIRTSDLEPAAPSVRPELAPTSPGSLPAVTPAARPVAASGVATRSEPLSRAKRTEGKYLRSGFETTLASVITLACPTKGFRQVFGADASALIVFEAARLLRKYPAFNAYHDDGVAHYYDEVNVGFAVDAGRGLKVPIIKGADRKGVSEIGSEMRDLVVSYLGDTLSVESLSGGTFTLTDLSGEGVVAFHPLINRGQSAILGVCAEVFPAGSKQGTFNLVLAFDHQLAEGRTAARFLGDLRDRLAAHESSALSSQADAGPGSSTEEPRCSRCQASYSELVRDGHFLVQAYRADGSTRPLCKLCLEGWT